jgi:hypothetical protein
VCEYVSYVWCFEEPYFSASVTNRKYVDHITFYLHTGIVVGVAIGLGSIVLCAVAIVWRRRCIKSAPPECSGAATGSSCRPGGLHANGNGYYGEWDRCPAGHAHKMTASSENHEMDYFAAAVATNIPCDSSTDHLDTKVILPLFVVCIYLASNKLYYLRTIFCWLFL